MHQGPWTPQMLRSSCTSRESNWIGPPAMLAFTLKARGVEVHRHGNIDQAVAGEDLEAGAVRVDDQALLAGSERSRSALSVNAELLLRAS